MIGDCSNITNQHNRVGADIICILSFVLSINGIFTSPFLPLIILFFVKYVLTLFVNYLITLYKQNVVHVPKMTRDNLSKYVACLLYRKITSRNISFLPIFTSLFEKSTLFACNALKLWRTQAKYINEVNYLLYSYTAGSGRVFPSAA